MSTSEAVFRCEVDAADLEAFVACVTLGVVEAMKSGLWPLEAGVWTLGRPIFWDALERAGISEALLNVLKGADELDTLARLCGPVAADAALTRMAEAARATLAEKASSQWRADWSGPLPAAQADDEG